jgi:hypothetical protein
LKRRDRAISLAQIVDLWHDENIEYRFRFGCSPRLFFGSSPEPTFPTRQFELTP